MEFESPYEKIKQTLSVNGTDYTYYNLPALEDERVAKLPYSIRVLLECAIRNCDGFAFKQADVEKILDWEKNAPQGIEIPFKPARVLLQDFTGVPAVVDLAAMRTAIVELGADADKINPQVPVDLVIDHSVQVDHARVQNAQQLNEEIEMQRNKERFQFLKWGQQAFENFKIVPPGSGIVHQVNLEYLGRVVMQKDTVLYPDSLVGTDSHTTMINGLGIVGWGVGGIEAEATMLGQQISMVLPEVVGVRLTGKLQPTTTATDLVLTVTNILRKRGCVGKFVEFFGEGVQTLSLPDRATISNMAPEYGATLSYFPVDEKTVEYMKLTGRDEAKLELIQQYLRANGLFRNYGDASQDPVFTGDIVEVDLSTIEASLAGPKRPQDQIKLSEFAADFQSCLTNNVGFKGFGYQQDALAATQDFQFDGQDYTLHHGSLVIAAITSCTNTSNPDVMIAAGLVAKNAVERGLTVKPYIKTSLSPGSKVVTEYLAKSGLDQYLDKIGFTLAGYGCMTCIGNSGDIPPEVTKAIEDANLCVSAVLSGNRNFEGRVHSLTKANYLASPPLVVSFALAGRVDLDLITEPLGTGSDGNPVFLKDIWPTKDQIEAVVRESVTSEMFKQCYADITQGSQIWRDLEVEQKKLYGWGPSTYINLPPFFQGISLDLTPISDVENAYCLLNVGDSVTTDHISPAGKIATVSPAAKFLQSQGVQPKDFNSYGSRRGNDLVMARGTFANIRLKNKMCNMVEGPHTMHVPTDKKMPVYDAAALYKEEGAPLIVLAGTEYGTGSSRDWAAKGPYLQGVKVVVAASYERIHRSNLVGMGILPLQFLDGQNADSLGLTGFERFSIKLNGGQLTVGQQLEVTVDNGTTFTTLVRLDTDPEVTYFQNGGILQTVLRNLARE